MSSTCERSKDKIILHLILLTQLVSSFPIIVHEPSPTTVSPTNNDVSSYSSSYPAPVTERKEIIKWSTERSFKRNKRSLMSDFFKQAKKAKYITYGEAANNAFKQVSKSVFRSAVKIGIGITAFNHIQPKWAQVLDFKTRLLKNIVLQDADEKTAAHYQVASRGTKKASISKPKSENTLN